jgi:hypothetical protein
MKIITSSPIKFKIGAELIKFYQKTEFSHIAIIKDDLVFQASHGYVNCTYIDNFLAENFIIDHFEVTESSVDMNFVYRQLGKKYSYMQILEIAIKYLTGIRISKKNDKFICSEFVGKALRLDWVDDFTSPKDIDAYLKSLEKK